MLTQNQLKTIFAEHGFAPLKRLGANYLIDANIKDKIISEVSPSAGETILEIGPGLGALTFDLAESGADVVAVEKDRMASAILAEMAAHKYPRLNIIHGDILDFDLKSIGKKEIKVAGNLPYYITTPIIEYILNNKSLISSAVIMVQSEVANRLTAKAKTEDYGALSCYVQYHAAISRVYTVKRRCFYPVPDVDSAIIRLDILKSPSVTVKNEGLLFKIIRGAFNQRRKSIINSLLRDAVLGIPKDKLSVIFDRAGVSPAARPETLSLFDFARIAEAIN